MDLVKSIVVLLIVGVILYILKHLAYVTWNNFHATRRYSKNSSDDLRDRAFAWFRLVLLGVIVVLLGTVMALLSVNPTFVWWVVAIGLALILAGWSCATVLDRRANRLP